MVDLRGGRLRSCHFLNIKIKERVELSSAGDAPPTQALGLKRQRVCYVIAVKRSQWPQSSI